MTQELLDADIEIVPENPQLRKVFLYIEFAALFIITVGLILKHQGKDFLFVLQSGVLLGVFTYSILSWKLFIKYNQTYVKVILAVLSGLALSIFCINILLLSSPDLVPYRRYIYPSSQIILATIVLNVVTYLVIGKKQRLNFFSWNIMTKLVFALVMQKLLEMGLLFG